VLVIGAEGVRQIIYAMERAERRLQGEAEKLLEAGDYSSEFPAQDAVRMREAIELLRSLESWVMKLRGGGPPVAGAGNDGGGPVDEMPF
jgi:hypothetical protein